MAVRCVQSCPGDVLKFGRTIVKHLSVATKAIKNVIAEIWTANGPGTSKTCRLGTSTQTKTSLRSSPEARLRTPYIVSCCLVLRYAFTLAQLILESLDALLRGVTGSVYL